MMKSNIPKIEMRYLGAIPFIIILRIGELKVKLGGKMRTIFIFMQYIEKELLVLLLDI